MIVLHQGSGSPRRGTIRFHSLEVGCFAAGTGASWRIRGIWPTSAKPCRTAPAHAGGRA
jgi:hypothetical protein